MTEKSKTFPGGMWSLTKQFRKRIVQLTGTGDEVLPPLDVDFMPLADQPLPAPGELPEGASMVAQKRHDLLTNLQGHNELVLLHGLLISHLRKRNFPENAKPLFLRLWAEQEAWLLANLPTRWLISAAITFADHGPTEEDRHLGQSLKILFSLMKIYEAERVYAGFDPEIAHRLDQTDMKPLPMGMPGFALIGGDIEASFLGPIWRDAKHAPAVGGLARCLLEMLNNDPATVFRRLAIMRERVAKHRES